MAGDDVPTRASVHTFVFADLAGFTALTEAHGDATGAEMAGAFIRSVRALLPDAGCEVVKTIGDEVMVRMSEVDEAIELGRRVVAELARDRSPPVRVGIHSGAAIQVENDWYGASVNLASRIANAARPGEVLVSQATRDLASPGLAQQLTPRGSRLFKNIPDRVHVFSAAIAGGPGHELEIDPVCRMAVDRAQADSVSERHGRSYYFCSPACAGAFRAEPRRYIARSPRARAARSAFRTHLRIFVVMQGVFAAAWAIGALLDGPAFPWFLLIAVGWATPLALHYRAVRPVL
jgi:adenylate cyclase